MDETLLLPRPLRLEATAQPDERVVGLGAAGSTWTMRQNE